MSGYEDMKIRLSPRHARLSNHGGHDYLKSLENNNLNILQRLEDQIINEEKARLDNQVKENTFGLGAEYLKNKKFSVQMQPSASMVSRDLSPMKQISEKSEHSGGKKAAEDWIDPRYVVVFVKDGDVLGSCKSFKMNIQEIINKYQIKQPSYMRSVTTQHLQVKA